ncbi:MAG TPA: V-type ATP synthase subunit I [Methanomassiliicoccales archaeon]|jgi:V/A-type H+-transporting ATPase subunit I
MILPEKMTRILVVGSKESLSQTIDILYGLETVHLVDFSAEEPGFSLGSPLPIASDASQKLLKLRSMERDLDIKEVKGMEIEVIPIGKINSEVDETINGLEAEIVGVVETKSNSQARMHEIEQKKKQLEPFMTVPLPLELYTGYESLTVFTGYVKMDPAAALTQAVKQFEVYKSNDGKFVAVFVPKSEAAEAQKVLIQNGYTDMPAPTGKGEPAEEIKRLDEEYEVEKKTLEEATKKIDALREKHQSFILASDEHLSIEVEKAETPIRLGTTAHAFAMDAWVPSADVSGIEKELASKMGDAVLMEVIGEAPRAEQHEPAHTPGMPHKEPVEKVPTLQRNGKTVSKFEFLTELISVPRYNEIDPSTILAITFPIFFGLMVGDMGYGIPFLILGALGLAKCTSKEWRTIATMLFFGGIWATLFGFFLFGEAFGLHFYPIPDEMTWSSLLGVNLPHTLFGFIPVGIYSKLTDVKILLFLTVWIGIIHLYLGFGLGFYNKYLRHGRKHAIMEKGSWILILTGGTFLLMWIIDLLIATWLLSDTISMVFLALGVVTLVPGVLMVLKAEGATAILELPGLMSNMISYARLAAIGMSKAGLALAFNTIAFETILGFDPVARAGAGAWPVDLSIVMIIVAIVILIVGHLTVFILGILSAGMHGIRLHYVELFQKFYEGGGVKFNPLRIVRKRTSER